MTDINRVLKALQRYGCGVLMRDTMDGKTTVTIYPRFNPSVTVTDNNPFDALTAAFLKVDLRIPSLYKRLLWRLKK